jgi:hypothetical protein
MNINNWNTWVYRDLFPLPGVDAIAYIWSWSSLNALSSQAVGALGSARTLSIQIKWVCACRYVCVHVSACVRACAPWGKHRSADKLHVSDNHQGSTISQHKVQRACILPPGVSVISHYKPKNNGVNPDVPWMDRSTSLPCSILGVCVCACVRTCVRRVEDGTN